MTTGNPLGSSAPKDMVFNAKNLDVAMNGPDLTFVDRFGVTRYSMVRLQTLIATAVSEVAPTVTAAKAAVGAARDTGIVDIGKIVDDAQGAFDSAKADVNDARDSSITDINQSVTDVGTAETAAKQQMLTTAANLGNDLNNKHYDKFSDMIADPQTRDAVVAVVDKDPNKALNGWYKWSKAANAWLPFYDQPAMTSALNKATTPRKRPLGPVTGDTPLIWTIGDMLVSLPLHKKRPLGPDGRMGAFVALGDSVMQSVEHRKRPLTEAYPDDFIILAGDSVAFRSGMPGAPVVPVTPLATYDNKLMQAQNQAPVGKRQPAISGGQVWAYDPLGATKLTAEGTWLAAYASAFDIVRALKSNSGNPQPHSITRDGRIVRDGNVLFHKLATGQSLALSSRSLVLDANGEFTLEGRKGNLFTPYVPADYAGRMLTLPGGPRPTSWTGATAFEPVREYFSGVLGESPASTYMLSMLDWYDRHTSIAPRLLYSISARGGTAYAGLKKGTQTYTDLIAQVTAAKAIATPLGLDYSVPSISIVHGESQVGTTQAEYVAMLAEWISNLQADIMAITGQTVPPVAFISQMLTGENGTVPAIPLAQLQAHNENPSIIMIGPKYAYGYFDTYHMLADGYMKTGGLEARAERLTQVSGKWQPLKVMSATVSGTTITLRLNNLPAGNAATPGPVGKLVIDRELVSDPGNAGFQLSSGAILSVALGADGASIVITTSTAVAPGTVITYALQNLNSSQTGNGRRGCIRDTDLRDNSRYDNKPLYNWLCATSMELQ